MLKIWINGANGRIGRAIQSVANPLEYEILKTDQEELDISNSEDVFSFGEVNRPDVIINCTGITDIGVCEKDPTLAYKVNAIGARNLSIVSRKIEAKLVQISTDDVFDGRSLEPYNEFAATNPHTVYGKSKLAGEIYVKEFTQKHFIVRSNWVYGEGESFVSRFLKEVEDGQVIQIPSDQYGSPTSAIELARFILFIMNTHEYGTYHATCEGSCSRYLLAKEILRITNKKARLQAVPSNEIEALELRPAFAVLDNFILRILNEYSFPNWKTALNDYLLGGDAVE